MKATRVTLEVEGGAITFRRPTLKDYWLARGSLPEGLALPDGKAESIDDARALQMLEFADRLLSMCSISPKLIRETYAEERDGQFSIDELLVQDRMRMMDELMKSGGFEQEAIEAARPLPETPAS